MPVTGAVPPSLHSSGAASGGRGAWGCPSDQEERVGDGFATLVDLS